MSLIHEVRTWIWVVQYWLIVYFALLATGLVLGTEIAPDAYWYAFIIGVPLTIAPITYRKLVGGGCSIRFQICALVKGAIVGTLFYFASAAMDPVIWNILQEYVGWNATTLPSFTDMFYLVWFIAGIIGGFAARIVEVRQLNSPQSITIAGYQDS
jgi:hypothetical protein